MAVGSNTRINHFTINGRMTHRNGTQHLLRSAREPIVSHIINAVTGMNAATATALSIVSNAIRASGSQSHRLGDQQAATGGGRLAGRELGANYWLYRNTNSTNGHSLEILAEVERNNRGAQITNTGNVQIRFDVYWGGRRHGAARRTFNTPFTYTLSANN